MLEEKKSIGSVKISKDVLVKITEIATKEIEGVHSLKSSDEMKTILPKSVNVNIVDDLATVYVSVVFMPEANIPSVTSTIQKNVKEAIQSMTGITVSKVNVIASGINY